MSERVKVFLVEMFSKYLIYVELDKELYYITDKGNASKSHYYNIEELKKNKWRTIIPIIDEPIPPRWTVEDHLYNFLGEELYNEFWCECDEDKWSNPPPRARMLISSAFYWIKSVKGHDFWCDLDIKWKKYCKEMNLG